MRKIIALCLILLLAFSANSMSEESASSTQSYQDMLENLDYEDLLALSTAVTSELASRPESQPLVLSEGMYLVGSDIVPGIYYFTSPTPDLKAQGCIYTSKTTYENRYDTVRTYPAGFVCEFSVKTPDTQRIILEADNLLEVYGTVILCTDKASAEKFYTYTPPEGNYVPAGIYTVGDDIPEGIYRFYSTTGYVVLIEIYKDGKRIEKLEPTIQYQTTRLSNGDEIKIDNDIIMIKQPSLSFE